MKSGSSGIRTVTVTQTETPRGTSVPRTKTLRPIRTGSPSSPRQVRLSGPSGDYKTSWHGAMRSDPAAPLTANVRRRCPGTVRGSSAAGCPFLAEAEQTMATAEPAGRALVLLDFQRDFVADDGRMPVARHQVAPVLAAARCAADQARLRKLNPDLRAEISHLKVELR
jgi:hypothetical protein